MTAVLVFRYRQDSRMTTPLVPETAPVAPTAPPAPTSPDAQTATTGPAPAIELAHAARWYGNVVAVNDVSFSLGAGSNRSARPQRRG